MREQGPNGAPQGRPANPNNNNNSFLEKLSKVLLYGAMAFTVLSISQQTRAKQPAGGDTRAEGDRLTERQWKQVERHADGYAPIAAPGDPFDVTITSNNPSFEPIHFSGLRWDHSSLAGSVAEHTVNRSFHLGDCYEANCTMSLHVVWTMNGFRFERVTPITHFFPVQEKTKENYLFSPEEEREREEAAPANVEAEAPYKMFVQPKLTISALIDFSDPLPPAFLNFTPLVDGGEGTRRYGPALVVNNFWVLRDHHTEVNASTTQSPITLTVELAPLAMWKWLMFDQYEQSMRQQQAMGLTSADGADEMKRILLESNPLLLAVTAVVTVLHMLFEYLAFKNDVSFWKGRKDFRGISLKTVAMNCYTQGIIFLYLFDSGETSWTVLLPSGLGVLMEFWKLTKTVSIVRKPSEGPGAGKSGLSLFGYQLQFIHSYNDKTRKYDEVGVKYLLMAIVPLLLGYAVYSAVFLSHKGWYSYFINTQVQFIYVFGFAMMTPQIFINYKMKSVGQLPWRTLVYKSLNTVIDDLFAFIIKMPWLHRVACFRDDVVFAILLYQRWIYPVDPTRNATDSDGEDDEGDAAPAGAPQALEEKKNQ